MKQPEVQPGRLLEQPTADGSGIARQAYGEFVSGRGELASYAFGWTTGAPSAIARLTVGLGVGNPGGGTFHAEVINQDDSYAMRLVDDLFTTVPEGGPHLSRDAGLAHECVEFVWFVADMVMARDPRALWMRHWLACTRAIVTPQVASGEEPALLVQHDDDGVWQVIGTTDADGATGQVMHFWHLIDADQTIVPALDLEPTERFERDHAGAPWVRRPPRPEEPSPKRGRWRRSSKRPG